MFGDVAIETGCLHKGRKADLRCKRELNGELEESGRSGLRSSFLRCAYAAKVSNEPIAVTHHGLTEQSF